ncbi:MAG: hypothetical protein AAF727_02685, partial [Pseudomonadota bacterium]
AKKNIAERQKIVDTHEEPIKCAKAQINDAFDRHCGRTYPNATEVDMKLEGQVKASDDFVKPGKTLETKRAGYQTLMKSFLNSFPKKELKAKKLFTKSHKTL